MFSYIFLGKTWVWSYESCLQNGNFVVWWVMLRVKKKKKRKDWGRKEKGELKEIYSFADFELTNQKRTLRVKFLYFWYVTITHFDSFSPEDGHIHPVEAHEVDKIKLAGDFTIEKVFSGLFHFHYKKLYFTTNSLSVFARRPRVYRS